MKQSEKLDLILKGLYETYCDDVYISLEKLIQQARIPLSGKNAVKNKAKMLSNADLIYYKNLEFDIVACLTPKGITFCKTSSYLYPGHPIITISDPI